MIDNYYKKCIGHFCNYILNTKEFKNDGVVNVLMSRRDELREHIADNQIEPEVEEMYNLYEKHLEFEVGSQNARFNSRFLFDNSAPYGDGRYQQLADSTISVIVEYNRNKNKNK